MFLSVTVWAFTALAFHYAPAPRAQRGGPGVEKPERRTSPARVHPELRSRLRLSRANA